MSANLYWSPIRKGKNIPVNAPSSFIAAMERALGSSQPWTVLSSDTPILRGLAAGLEHERDAIEAILDALDKHEQIKVWAEY